MTLDELRGRATIERDGYHVFDGEFAQMAVTLEDAEFLHSLVRLVRPRRVLELGTGLGVAARFIAEALMLNDNGAILLTHEPNRDLWPRAETVLLGTPSAVTGLEFSPDDELVELVFIDSGYQTRPADIQEWLSNGYRGLVCVHDSHRDYPGLAKGVGVYLPGVDGLWLGRAA